MYSEKHIEKSEEFLLLYQTTWIIDRTVSFRELRIMPRAVLKAPEGKFLTLTVNGVGQDIEPGIYKGDITLSVTESFFMKPAGLMEENRIGRYTHTAVVVEDGKVTHTVPAIIQGGHVSDECTDGIYLASTEECFNGVIVSGNSEYTVRNMKADFEGFGDNDFLGIGCAVAAIDTAKVKIENCEFNFMGTTRCALHVGGHSEVEVSNTRMTNFSPSKPDWTGDFSWQIGFIGQNRLAQLCDSAKVVYDNCDLRSNGWGILSIDGWDGGLSMMVKNSRLELTGPHSHGYGAFCIGDNAITYDNCDVDVNGYPMMVMGMCGRGRAAILNSRIRGRRFGALICDDDNSIVTIENTSFKTTKSTLCIKGSATKIDVKNTTMEPENGVLVQLMDPDESGMNVQRFFVPVGEIDQVVEGRELSVASDSEDVILNLTDCTLTGDIYNSTTNIRACNRCARGEIGRFHDTVIGALHQWNPENGGDVYGESIEGRHNGDDLRGPKNLGLTLNNTRICGVISSALQAYRDGLTVITADERMEIGNVTQTAAPTVNNGIILCLDGNSEWVVAGTSYITALKLEPGAKISAPEGKTLVMNVDGRKTEPKAGSYAGKIVLSLE